ncbi:hypothetical protein FQR65_LT16101 [Abscondita terminalis]|nr:hypothetical protein FQR65_LT16101 [Abscondita terminalis]
MCGRKSMRIILKVTSTLKLVQDQIITVNLPTCCNKESSKQTNNQVTNTPGNKSIEEDATKPLVEDSIAEARTWSRIHIADTTHLAYGNEEMKLMPGTHGPNERPRRVSPGSGKSRSTLRGMGLATLHPAGQTPGPGAKVSGCSPGYSLLARTGFLLEDR